MAPTVDNASANPSCNALAPDAANNGMVAAASVVVVVGVTPTVDNASAR